MKDVAVENVRNFALLGHTGCGKTTLLDAIMFKLGVTERKGSPEDGTSIADFNDEEKKHKISIWAKPFEAIHTSQGGRRVGVVAIDTPGYADFVGQMIAATTVADSGMILVDASSGIQVGTSRAWKRCEDLHLPRGVVIAGIDKDNADYEGTLTAIQERWGAKCVPVTIPVRDRSRVINVLEAEAPPADIADRARELKGQLVEFAAETDDALIEKYLAGEPLTADEIAAGLHGAVRDGSLIPVFAVSAKAGVGIADLIEGISLLYPSPLDCPHKDDQGTQIVADPNGPFTGLVWRTVNDPFSGQLSFIRVFSGTLSAESDLVNPRNGEKERIGHLFLVNGRKQEEIKLAVPGDIVAVPKLKNTRLNDTLCAAGKHLHFKPIEFPRPVASYAIEAKTRGDEDKMSSALHRITDEDPTLTLRRDEATREFIFSGMGDVQIEVALEQMKARNNVEVVLSTPKVAYRETIGGKGEGHYKHKKQSGGRGQYAEVYLRVEPLLNGEEDWFANAVVGGTIPTNFIPAVHKGLVEGLQAGPLARYPVEKVKVTVYDGSSHDVDSSEVAFKIAASRALRDGLSKAKPTLLEPVMRLTVTIPEQFMGDINGDLNHKRGRILGMGSEEGHLVIEAEVPQSELFKYSSELRSITGGRGNFEMEFSRYETVPQHVAQKVIAAAMADVKDED